MSESDADLIARAARRDEDALSELLARHGPALRDRVGASIGPRWRSSVEVDDVMQVTYLEAFLNIDRLSSMRAEGFTSWLRHIAENNLRDAIRALEADKRPDPRRRVRGPAGESSLVALVDLLGVTTTTPSRAAARDEAVGFLERALSELPPDYEAVVRRYDLEGNPVEEVAKALGRSEGAVYMLRARAHDRLRELMGGASRFFSHGA